eukprot:TRINITY_DN66_c0_g1_i1.p1 TRINITY_DN66_c0_g1~~TRINITY_DN66_c0_g1_i1.p1  ORF type:complete len:404 (+),score=92.30 TRINITY_DN66_c0_g1_i1:129-1340(+)
MFGVISGITLFVAFVFREEIFLIIRKLVSQEKKRFQKDNFDLDLSYITDRIIAAGFPAKGLESIWRNPINQVSAFLHKYHPGHFLVMNVSARRYNISPFDGNVKTFNFADHHPPPIEMLHEMCVAMHEFIRKDPRNVVMVHCLAGRGRTGTLICAYLVYSGYCKTPEDAFRLFGDMRSKKGKGIRNPSQRRYVSYYAQLLQKFRPEKPIGLMLRHVVFRRPPVLYGSAFRPIVEILFPPVDGVPSHVIARSSPKHIKTREIRTKYMGWKHGQSDSEMSEPESMRGSLEECTEVALSCELPPMSDLYMRVYHAKDEDGDKQKYVFRCHWNSGFVPQGDTLVFGKNELDDGFKDHRLASSFAMELHFDGEWQPKDHSSSGKSAPTSRPRSQSVLRKWAQIHPPQP